MNPNLEILESTDPVVSERECGGWLATTPPESELRIGVTALTEGEVRALFERAMHRWVAALDVRDSM